MHKRLSLEMGGKNAQIVLDDADLDLALEGVLWGAFGTTGQRCTATSRLILQDGIHDEFLEPLVDRARALKLGDGRKKGTDVGPLINEASRDEGRALRRHRAGGGRRPAVRRAARRRARGSSNGFFFEPTIFARVRAGHAARAGGDLRSGALGDPRRRRRTRRSRVNNDVKYGLSSSVYTRDVNVAFRALNELDNGITYVNAPTIGAEAHLPVRRGKADRQRAPRGRLGGLRVLLGDQGRLRATSRARCSGRRSTTTSAPRTERRSLAASVTAACLPRHCGARINCAAWPWLAHRRSR